MPGSSGGSLGLRRAVPLLESLFWRTSYGTLSGLLVFTLVLGPYFRERGGHGGALILLLILSGLVATTSAGTTRPVRRLVRLAFLPLLSIDLYILIAGSGPWLRIGSILGHLTLCLFTAAAILRRLLRQQHLTLDALLGGITVYLLIGYLFYFGYDVIESVHPGSFQFQGRTIDAPGYGHHLLFYPQLLFFSFGTLTTVGYGEITPTWSLPRSLGLVEALTGQIYMATLLAILVSSYITGRHALRPVPATTAPRVHPAPPATGARSDRQ